MPRRSRDPKVKVNPILALILVIGALIVAIAKAIGEFISTYPIISVSVVVLTIGGMIYFIQLKEKTKRAEDEKLALRISKLNSELMMIQKQYEQSGVPLIESDIILKRGERLYAKLLDITWSEIRRETTSLNISGFSARVPFGSGISYKSGSYNIERVTSDQLTQIDSGDLYFTNKSMLFRGKLGNKNITHSKILNIIPHLEGIIIEKETGRSIFISCSIKTEQLVALMLTWAENRQ